MESVKYYLTASIWSETDQRYREEMLTCTYDIAESGEKQNLVVSDGDGDPIITSPWPEVEGQLIWSLGYYIHNYYKPEDIDEALYQVSFWNSLYENPCNERFAVGKEDTPVTLELCDVVEGPYEHDYRVVDYLGDEI